MHFRQIFTLKGIAIVMVLFWIVSQPIGAADFTNRGIAKIQHAGNQVAAYLSNVGK